MKYRSRVIVETPAGEFLFARHREYVIGLVASGAAIRISSGVVRLKQGSSLGSIRADARAPRIEAPKRRSYHQHTTPAPSSKLPHLFRADTGQTGAVRAIIIRPM